MIPLDPSLEKEDRYRELEKDFHYIAIEKLINEGNINPTQEEINKKKDKLKESFYEI